MQDQMSSHKPEQRKTNCAKFYSAAIFLPHSPLLQSFPNKYLRLAVTLLTKEQLKYIQCFIK